MPNIGDRVRVAIRNHETWNRATFDIVQGATGTVESVSGHHSPGNGPGAPREQPYVLVRFDVPLPKPWGSARDGEATITHHHFDADELEVLS